MPLIPHRLVCGPDGRALDANRGFQRQSSSKASYAYPMKALRKLRTLSHLRRWRRSPTFVRGQDDLLELTERFCAAPTPSTRVRRATLLFHSIWSAPSDRRASVRLLRWIRLLEQNRPLQRQVAQMWDEMLAGFDFVPLFTQTGLPSHHALSAEVVRRLFERLLPLRPR